MLKRVRHDKIQHKVWYEISQEGNSIPQRGGKQQRGMYRNWEVAPAISSSVIYYSLLQFDR
jgi:hypothetical protein